jgi:hypothetical protein
MTLAGGALRLAGFVAGAALGFGVPRLSAQTPGLPIYAGGHVPGVALGAALGLAPARSPVGRGITWVGTAELATRRTGLRVVGGALDLGGGSSPPPRAVWGALATARVLDGGVESPLSLDLIAGHGRSEGADTRLRHTVVGLAFVLTIPTPVMAVKPWLAPRFDWRSVPPPPAAESRIRHAFGGSAGVDLRFLGGVVLRAAWDKVEGTSRVIGFAAAYHF